MAAPFESSSVTATSHLKRPLVDASFVDSVDRESSAEPLADAADCIPASKRVCVGSAGTSSLPAGSLSARYSSSSAAISSQGSELAPGALAIDTVENRVEEAFASQLTLSADDALSRSSACSSTTSLATAMPADEYEIALTLPGQQPIYEQLSFLPHELILLIMSFVPPMDLVRSRRVCKLWLALTHDWQLWHMLCRRHLSAEELTSKPRHKNFEWLYLAYRVRFATPATAHGVGHVRYPSGDVYSGDLVHGQREGWGVYVQQNMHRYEGEWHADKEHGRGTKLWQGGSRYEGEFFEGRRHGRARIMWGKGEWDGDVYEGEWHDDYRSGSGVYVWTNGDKYLGQWHDSKISGRGTKLWANGDSYDGHWLDDERHGPGTYRWPSGNCYAGVWRDGKTSGYGTKVWANGDSYDGEWQHDQRHGFGVYVWVSGTVFAGQWRDGKKDGRGVCVWSDGAAYDGAWSRNFRHGRGRYLFPDGAVYDGQWLNNVRHGQGTMQWRDGGVWRGEWLGDQRVGHSGAVRQWDQYFARTFDQQRVYLRQTLAALPAAPTAQPLLASPPSPSSSSSSSSQPAPQHAPAHYQRVHHSLAVSAPVVLTSAVSHVHSTERAEALSSSSSSSSNSDVAASTGAADTSSAASPASSASSFSSRGDVLSSGATRSHL